MEAEVVKYLSELNLKIRRGCTAHITRTGRLYYMNHETKTSSWLPPVESWDPGALGLPYGWEAAFDRDGKTYFINHVNRTTTGEDPRQESDEEPPQPRHLELARDPQRGFGFVAGSERPVIVRFVTDGGPSEGLLLPGDQILQINGEDVAKSPRERVIELVRSCKHSVKLQVCQPITNNSTRKSALLTAAKKARLKSNPCRVRFAEGVVINGSPLYCPSPFDSHVPFMPNVLKVFLENGQTKSFKYDGTTTVQEVLDVLQEKLSVASLEHFSLAVEHVRSMRRNKLSILNPRDTLAKIAARPGAHHLRCLFRLTFVPKDVYELMQRDPVAFEYLFVQCSNDVSRERFAPELKYDVALRLAALHLQEHAAASGMQAKAVVKAIEKEYGLERFVPQSLLETMKRKELLKLLGQLVKQNRGPSRKPLTATQARFHYLRIVADLPAYGARTFATCCKSSAMETAILVGPRIGISQISTIRNIAPINLCQFSELENVQVTREDDFSYKIRVQLRHPEKESLNMAMEEREAEEFVLVVERYHRQLVGTDLPVEWEGRDPEPVERVPSYHSRHIVQDSPWSYCPAHSQQQQPQSTEAVPTVKTIDLSIPPPPYILCEERRLSRSNSRDEFSLATSPSSVDHNMNALVAPFAAEARPDRPDDAAARLQAQSCEGVDLHSVLSMELLEEGEDEQGRDVLLRVTEMGRMVSDAQLYLRGGDDHTPPGLLSPSLVSESEAESSPADSPARDPPPPLSDEGQSFGLHSPHPHLTAAREADDVEELLRQLHASTSLPLGEEALCLDPDLIDLTIVPPPAPDDVDFGCEVAADQQLVDRETGQLENCHREDEADDDPPPAEPPAAARDPDDLSAYIIPPPPPTSSRAVEEQDRVLARFKQAAEEIQRMMAHGGDAHSLHSVSRFCTIPRRHDDPHRLALFSAAEEPRRPQPPPRARKGGEARLRQAPAETGFSRTLSLDSFKGESQKKERTSQDASIPPSPSGPPPSDAARPLTNGCSGPPPDVVCPSCDTPAAEGCACRRLLLSRHQSLPRKGPPRPAAFRSAERDIADMVSRLDAACRARLQDGAAAGDDQQLERARDALVGEARQFVTASKLFVRSITESSDRMEENLAACLALLGRIFAVGERLVGAEGAPARVRCLAERLRETALAYARTVEAARCAAAADIPNADMAGLMQRATALATSLTTLMRTLRSFHGP